VVHDFPASMGGVAEMGSIRPSKWHLQPVGNDIVSGYWDF
jgi:hypothetical protein